MLFKDNRERKKELAHYHNNPVVAWDCITRFIKRWRKTMNTMKFGHTMRTALIFLALAVRGLAENVTTNAKPTEYVLPSWGNGASEIVITLPGDWEQKTNKGPDFDVHWLSCPLGGSLGIYVGHNPKTIARTADTTKTNLMVGGSPIIFLVTPIGDGIKTQAIVDHFFKGSEGAGVSGLKLHVMINGENHDFMDAVQQGLKTLKPKKIANKVPEDTARKLADPQH